MSDEVPQPSLDLETGETGTDVSTQALTQALRGGFVILYVVIFILAGYFLFSNFSRVEPGQRSVVLRFGRPLQTSGDEVLTEGKMVFAWPYPVDEKVDISGEESSVFSSVGWYGGATGTNIEFSPERDGYVLTRDWNILHIQAELRYEVEDPILYDFGFGKKAAEEVLRSALDNAIVVTAAGYEAEDILESKKRLVRVITENKKEELISMGFRDALNRRLRHLVNVYDLGITVKSVTLKPKPVLPRGKVSARHRDLLELREIDQRIDKAEKQAEDMRKKAGVRADNIIKDAEVDAKQLKQRVNNEFAEFDSLWKNFKDNPSGLQLELEKRLRDVIRRTLSDPKVEITKLPAGPDGGRPKVKLVVRRLQPKPQKATGMEGPGGSSARGAQR